MRQFLRDHEQGLLYLLAVVIYIPAGRACGAPPRRRNGSTRSCGPTTTGAAPRPCWRKARPARAETYLDRRETLLDNLREQSMLRMQELMAMRTIGDGRKPRPA